jgi:predicted transcriptional regulator
MVGEKQERNVENRILWADKADIADIARALDSEVRRKILDLLVQRPLNVNQIAEALDIPQSTCTVNTQILEKAKLLHIEKVAASRGAQKVCSVRWEEIVLPLKDITAPDDDRMVVVDMPIGLYTDHKATAPCGMVNDTAVVGFFDQTETFLNPKRATAGLIWMTRGFLEYRFPKATAVTPERIAALSVTFEVCSEFPGYNNTWPSDITVWFNGLEVGTWTSPGDMGGNYGRLTPRWWDLLNSQYGSLKTWKVTGDGAFIDGVRTGNLTLGDLDLDSCDYYSVKIGVKDDAEFVGGFNLFGRTFGNYEQDIVLRLELND